MAVRGRVLLFHPTECSIARRARVAQVSVWSRSAVHIVDDYELDECTNSFEPQTEWFDHLRPFLWPELDERKPPDVLVTPLRRSVRTVLCP
jgi:hypothetical protein